MIDRFNNKILVLVEEHPKLGTFEATCSDLGLYKVNNGAIDPIDFLDPESHTLGTIYSEIFTDTLANELLGYLISRHPQDLVYDVVDVVYGSTEKLIIINTTILKQTEVDFLISLFEGTSGVMTYRLTGNVGKDSKHIYCESKKYRDVLEKRTSMQMEA